MNNNSIEIQSMPMPITQKAIRQAWQFAAEQGNPQKVEQIYLNTLAVLAVRDYLKILDIETDLTECDSWNPVIRIFENAADLYIKGLGKIECRPIRGVHQMGENLQDNLSENLPDFCPVPLEDREERIGYIVVEIDEDAKEARLLGFSPTAGNGELVLSELHSLDDFLLHLEHLSESKISLRLWLENLFTSDWESIESIFNPQPETATEIENPVKSNLGNWFKNLAETGWQKIEQGKESLENLISPEENHNFAFRGGGNSRAESALRGRESSINSFPEADVTRAKLIDLGMRLGRTTVALLVAIAEEDDSLRDSCAARTFRVHVQLYPAIGERYLPGNIKLSLISDIGENLHEVKSTVQNLCILLNDFHVEPGESFSIRVALDDLSVTENFVI